MTAVRCRPHIMGPLSIIAAVTAGVNNMGLGNEWRMERLSQQSLSGALQANNILKAERVTQSRGCMLNSTAADMRPCSSVAPHTAACCLPTQACNLRPALPAHQCCLVLPHACRHASSMSSQPPTLTSSAAAPPLHSLAAALPAARTAGSSTEAPSIPRAARPARRTAPPSNCAPRRSAAGRGWLTGCTQRHCKGV